MFPVYMLLGNHQLETAVEVSLDQLEKEWKRCLPNPARGHAHKPSFRWDENIKYQGRKVSPESQGPSLDNFTGSLLITNSASDISTRALKDSTLPSFGTHKAHKIIYLKNRSFGPTVSTDIYVVEPFHHAEVPIWMDRPSFFLYLITHPIPWIVVTIADQSKRRR